MRHKGLAIQRIELDNSKSTSGGPGRLALLSSNIFYDIFPRRQENQSL